MFLTMIMLVQFYLRVPVSHDIMTVSKNEHDGVKWNKVVTHFTHTLVSCQYLLCEKRPDCLYFVAGQVQVTSFLFPLFNLEGSLFLQYFAMSAVVTVSELSTKEFEP